MNKSVFVGIAGAFVCALAVWHSARIGFARSSALQALKMNDVAAAERAVSKLPADAEVHAARGIVLQRTGDYTLARSEFEQAIRLRPRDYFLWMMLGVTRDLDDDSAAGVAALRQSLNLAPTYAQPRWLIGNLLLRTGDIDEGFQHLRIAEEGNHALSLGVVDLAWGISRYDPARTVELIQPQSDEAHMALAVFLAGHKQGAAAIDQFRLATARPRAVTDQLMQRLIESKSYTEAYEVWTKTRCASCRPAQFINGGFEDDIELDNQIFGWQIPANINGVTASIDTAEHESGAKSLRVDFHGNADPQTKLVSQLVVVEPGKRYRVSFRALTKSFVSTGVPIVRVIDAADESSTTLAQVTVRPEASGWQSYVIDFASGANLRVVRLAVNRGDCPGNYCPAFGTLWLDSFQAAEASGQSPKNESN